MGGPGFTLPHANIIQKIIGFDLNSRFLSIQEGPVMRHPNMNMMIKRKILEEIGFNEKYIVGYDAILGYTLNRKGYSLWYHPKSFVWHHHRSTILGYMKQQYLSSRYAILILSRCREARKGDNINSITMIAQPFFFLLVLLTLITSMFNSNLIWLFLFFSISLFSIITFHVTRSMKLNKNFFALSLYSIYILRLPIWIAGAVTGMLVDKK